MDIPIEIPIETTKPKRRAVPLRFAGDDKGERDAYSEDGGAAEGRKQSSGWCGVRGRNDK